MLQIMEDSLGLEVTDDFGFVKKMKFGDLLIDALFPDRTPQEDDDYPGDETMMNDDRTDAFKIAKRKTAKRIR
jgi:hypothetical protein